MTAQPKVLPTTVALITDDATGGFVQLANLDEVDTHVDMLTAQGRDCTVWVRRPRTLTAEVVADAGFYLVETGPPDADQDETVRDAWRQR